MIKKTTPSAIQNEVMSQIHSGSVRMKPRLYFTVLWLLGIVSGIVASLTFAYIISIMIYILRIQTASTPAYGARQNLSEAIADFPWWALVVSIALSIIAIILMRKYSRMYRYKIGSIILIFITISALVGLTLSLADIGHSKKDNIQQKSNSGTHSQDGSGRGAGQNNNY